MSGRAAPGRSAPVIFAPACGGNGTVRRNPPADPPPSAPRERSVVGAEPHGKDEREVERTGGHGHPGEVRQEARDDDLGHDDGVVRVRDDPEGERAEPRCAERDDEGKCAAPRSTAPRAIGRAMLRRATASPAARCATRRAGRVGDHPAHPSCRSRLHPPQPGGPTSSHAKGATERRRSVPAGRKVRSGRSNWGWRGARLSSARRPTTFAGRGRGASAAGRACRATDVAGPSSVRDVPGGTEVASRRGGQARITRRRSSTPRMSAGARRRGPRGSPAGRGRPATSPRGPRSRRARFRRSATGPARR